MRMISVLLALSAWSAAAAQKISVVGGVPRVSRDGARILYTSDREGASRVYVMGADGSDARALSPVGVAAHSPAWAPDGRRIVFVQRGSERNQIVVADADGSNAHAISDVQGDQAPTWSPDGRMILFATGSFPTINVHAMNVDGSERKNLSPNPGFDYDPAWSPDGKHIVFVSASRELGPRVWVMDADGSNRRSVSTLSGGQERPAWSPDGRSIAFQLAIPDSANPRRAIDSYIVIVDCASGQARRIGQHDAPAFDETPSWFPDGRRLAIQSRREGQYNVYVMDLEGRVIARLTRP
jgi:Tol biopolymer transport system component